jgi:DNA-binding LacI/PurR family transcriptional regulator
MDGAIVYACTPQSEAVRHLLERHLPIVRVEGLPIEGIAGVSLDDEGGSAAAAAHLVDLGHRDIAIVTVGFDADGDRMSEPPPTHLAIIRRRMTGWLRALTAAGIRPRIYATAGPLIDDALCSRIDHMLDDPPTAVLAFSDLAALEVVDRARARGIELPGSLSVVGFDDNPVAQRVSPRLTTVRQDLQRKGEATVAALLQQLEGGRPESPEPLPTELVIRESTAPPPNRA